MSQSQSISNLNTINKCVRYLSNVLLSQWWRYFLSLPLVQKWPTQSQLTAFLGWTAGNARVAWSETTSNKRVFTGVVLIGMGAFFYQAHLLFINPDIPSPIAFINDPAVPIEVWHYKRWFYWFFTQREEFFFGLCSLGVFLMWPQKSGYRYIQVPLFVACLSEIIYQSFFISDWTHFFRGFFTLERGWEGIAIMFALGYAIKKVVDYQVHRKYHTKDGNTCRIVGVIEMDMAWSEKEKTLKQLAKEFRDYNSRI